MPLEPGERVLYFKHFTGSGERIFLFFMGLVFLVILWRVESRLRQ